MREEVKQLIKEAILEALAEFIGNGVMPISEESSGGKPDENGRPKPDVGVGVY